MSLQIGDCSPIYSEIKGLKKEDVDNLLKWCEIQPFLPKITEMQIINFLHSNNFSIDESKQCIDDFFTTRTNCPAFFTKRDPRDLNLNFSCITFPFEKKSADGCRIILMRLIDNNPNIYNFPEVIKIFDMILMLILNKEGPSEGHIFIFDLAGFSFSHLIKLNFLLVKKFIFYAQDCMPLQIKAIHCINIGKVLDMIMTLVRPFMKKELFDIMYMHQTMESIYKMIPKEYFSKDYPGGFAPSIPDQHRAQKECLLKNVEFFLEEEKQVVNEELRPPKPNNSGLFSVLKRLIKS